MATVTVKTVEEVKNLGKSKDQTNYWSSYMLPIGTIISAGKCKDKVLAAYTIDVNGSQLENMRALFTDGTSYGSIRLFDNHNNF